MRAFLRLVIGNIGRRMVEWAEDPLPHGEQLIERVRGGWDREAVGQWHWRMASARVVAIRDRALLRCVVSER